MFFVTLDFVLQIRFLIILESNINSVLNLNLFLYYFCVVKVMHTKLGRTVTERKIKRKNPKYPHKKKRSKFPFYPYALQ